MSRLSRRTMLSAAGLAAGGGLLSGFRAQVQGQQPPTGPDPTEWRYVRLDAAVVADAAYRAVAEGGCMYGLFSAVLKTWSAVSGKSCESFPFHMMRYGEGGIGMWGSICGTLNGGAAILGLFEKERPRRERLITELFSWYETAELPAYTPKGAAGLLEIPKSSAMSVLCHVSVGRWCEVSGYDVMSKEMGERCRRLTADVAARVVELLNRNEDRSGTFAGLRPEVKSCISCHGKNELRDSMGKMDCTSCHKLPKKHP